MVAKPPFSALPLLAARRNQDTQSNLADISAQLYEEMSEVGFGAFFHC
jgi:hypothetical protein